MKQKRNKESISIKKFLRLYYGIIDENLLNSKITHKALKILIPELKRLPFDYSFKNEEKIANGEILLVIDCNGIIIPYESPKAVKDIDDIEKNKNYNSKKEKAIEEIIELENLNIYQLAMLCRKYKDEHRIKEYRLTYRVLKEKKQKKEKSKKYMKRG